MTLAETFTSTGWRRRFTAVLLGICATAALPPVYVLPLLIPAFAGLLLFTQNAASRKQAFADGWWWGLGHFTSGLYWICISLWVEPDKFAWLTPIVLLGLPSILAIYTGLVTLILYCLTSPSTSYQGECGEGVKPVAEHSKQTPTFILPLKVEGGKKVILFALLWTAAEYLRAHLFTGFPWNLIGYVWTVSTATLQLASVTGIYGLSFITVLAASMPALFMYQNDTAKRLNIAAAMLLIGITLFGIVRLDAHPTRNTEVKVRIVQANIPQTLKWEPEAAMKGLRSHVRLTRQSGIETVNLVLWPETAVPYPLNAATPLAKDLGSILPPGALLIAGGLRMSGHEAWNSVFALDKDGNVIAQYDKHHLVPFGEYIPLRGLIPKPLLDFVAPGMGDFSRGSGPRTLFINNDPPVSPLICYEAIFPHEATDGTGRAQWLLSLTDDAWFGASSGPYQDAEMARVRAVEQGLPLLRAANTGVSAAYDGLGRQLATLPLEKEGTLDLYLPASEKDGTIFSRYSLSGLLSILAVSVLFFFMCPKKTGASL